MLAPTLRLYSRIPPFLSFPFLSFPLKASVRFLFARGFDPTEHLFLLLEYEIPPFSIYKGIYWREGREVTTLKRLRGGREV
jgi:hypothetical protein